MYQIRTGASPHAPIPDKNAPHTPRSQISATVLSNMIPTNLPVGKTMLYLQPWALSIASKGRFSTSNHYGNQYSSNGLTRRMDLEVARKGWGSRGGSKGAFGPWRSGDESVPGFADSKAQHEKRPLIGVEEDMLQELGDCDCATGDCQGSLVKRHRGERIRSC